MLLLCAAVVWASLLSSALAFSAADYASALDKSILFFDLQRSGTLPPWQRITWRGNSAVNDGRTSNVPISGLPILCFITLFVLHAPFQLLLSSLCALNFSKHVSWTSTSASHFDIY